LGIYAQTYGHITGRVSVAGGRELVRAEITGVASDGAIRIHHAMTDDQGGFALDVPPGRVLIVARADGYASEQVEVVTQPGRQNANVNFRLSPAGVVSGRVFGPTGGGIARARVWLQYRGEARAWRVADEAGGQEADELGYFTIPVVAQGRPFVLHAESDGWLPSSSGTMILRGQELSGVTLLLSRRGATISGQVLDSSGRPVSGAVIRLRVIPADTEFTAEQRESIALARSINKSVVSSAGGFYTFAGVPRGRVIISAETHSRRVAAEEDVQQAAEITVNLLLP
jgi:hypothetical protein